MKISAAAIAASLLLAAPSVHAQTAELAGTWRHTGTQQELVIRSVMEQRTTYSMSGDFRPGGSTVISTRPVPTQVRRDMTLTIRPDGGFDWMSDKTYPESSSCNVTLRQQRAGILTVSGTRGAFDIRQGSERASRSCNSNVSQSDRSGRTENYTISRSGSTLRLNDGTVTWVFTRAR
ncbi:hypothetical protein ACIQC9_10285 [Brevundimonas sp. NPDC092305]|uniref:hypothetical protein n=1 Tax=Brevundimonas sp. NPDC092305 TaxID=3363957 RepID=UPI0037FF2C31